MHDAEATHVSLVPRGANMIPFRIVKDDREEGNRMLNFQRVFKIKEAPAEVLAVVVPAESDEAKARIEAAGFSTEFKQEIDGAVAYIQQEDTELGQADHVIVKFDEGTSAIVRLKRFEPFGDSTSFDENLQKNGFLPGFDMALTVLRDTVFNALFEADDRPGAASTIDTAVKQFRGHIADMTAALPETAFKLDPAVLHSTNEDLAELITATKGSVVNFTMHVETGPENSVGAPSITNVDETQTEGGEEVAVSPAVSGSSSSLRKEDEKTEDTSEATQVAAKDEGQDGEGAEAKDADVTESDTSEIQKQIEAQGKVLSDGLATISKTLTDAVEGINEQVAALSERVEKTEGDVNGVVNVSPQDDPETARKSNGADTEPPFMDTGWDRLQAQ